MSTLFSGNDLCLLLQELAEIRVSLFSVDVL